jgi:putative transposase
MFWMLRLLVFVVVPPLSDALKLRRGLAMILDHGRRVIRHFNVTANPTTAWVKQQLREAFPFGEIPKYLIHDRDQTFKPLKAFLEALGITPKVTAYHCPWQNGFVERVHASLRKDLLDHVIPLNEDHLRRLLKEYLRYYHEDRTHLGLNKDSPRAMRVGAGSTRSLR